MALSSAPMALSSAVAVSSAMALVALGCRSASSNWRLGVGNKPGNMASAAEASAIDRAGVGGSVVVSGDVVVLSGAGPSAAEASFTDRAGVGGSVAVSGDVGVLSGAGLSAAALGCRSEAMGCWATSAGPPPVIVDFWVGWQ